MYTRHLKHLYCLCSYTYTAADVKQMVADKKARGSTRVNIAAEKARIIRERDHAQEVGDLDDIERFAPLGEGIALLLLQVTSLFVL